MASSLDEIARAIQLALTPVFLLTGIAGILNVMTGRLSRIVDRARALTEGTATAGATDQSELAFELTILQQRRHMASVGITACTIAALFVCLVIVVVFLEVMLGAPLPWLIGLLFMAAMLALIVGLTFFLREVHLAMRTSRAFAGRVR